MAVAFNRPATGAPDNSYSESLQSPGSTAWPVAVNVFSDLGSLTLNPGEYDLAAVLATINTAAVAAGNIFIGISTTAGDSSVGLADAVNTVAFYNTGAAGGRHVLTLPMYKVAPTSPTTYYFKIMYNAVPTNLNYFAARLSARKVN